MPAQSKNIFIIAGEASGDLNAQYLIRRIKALDPSIEFTGIGGPRLKNEGVNIIIDYKKVNFIGFTAVIKNYPAIKKLMDQCVQEVRDTDPDAVILVDFPGFNLKLAELIRKFYTGKIIYYISPQLWAWHKSRIKKVRKYVDKMLVVFPFEKDFYKDEGIDAEFVGHPLVERINTFLEKNEKRPSDKIRIGLLPGSRKEEVEYILPVLAETAEKLKNEFDAEINVICASNIDKDLYAEILKDHNFNLIFNSEDKELNYDTILNSDLLFTKSGTSTVECALIGTPFCVVYKTGKLNYTIGKALIKVKFLAMVNLLMGREIVKEYLQDEMNAANLYAEGKRILTDEAYRAKIKSDLDQIKGMLTATSVDAAEIIINSISK